MNDLVMRNEGSIWLAAAVSDAGRDYLEGHYNAEHHQYWAGQLVIEPRYVKQFVDLAREHGLNVN